MKSVLDPVVHKRLIAEIEEIAREAGIPRRFIESPLSDVCGAQEIEWVKHYRQHVASGNYGLCFAGVDHATKMMAMCGALTRNFVFARVVTVSQVIDELRAGEQPSASALFIPSFHRTTKQGAGVTPFQINLLWQLLESRLLQEKQTIIAIQSMSQLSTDYGQHFRDLVVNHYEVV